MIVIDSSGWIEFFADGPHAGEFASRLRHPENVITPTVAIYEVYKWIKRERSEDEALDAVATMKKTTVAEVAAFGSLIRGESDLETEAVIGQVREILRDSASRGFALTRIIGDTAWMAEHNPHLRELEPGYNELLEELDDVMLCAYDVTRLSAETVIEALRSHPLVLVAGTFRPNPFFTM